MQSRFLYSEECPSHEEALERLRQVMQEEAIQAEIEVVKVETAEQAQKLAYIGSPTILVNGRDIDPPPPNAYYAVSCRAYRLEDGRISPLPSYSMIRKAIRAAAKKQS